MINFLPLYNILYSNYPAYIRPHQHQTKIIAVKLRNSKKLRKGANRFFSCSGASPSFLSAKMTRYVSREGSRIRGRKMRCLAHRMLLHTIKRGMTQGEEIPYKVPVCQLKGTHRLSSFRNSYMSCSISIHRQRAICNAKSQLVRHENWGQGWI